MARCCGKAVKAIASNTNEKTKKEVAPGSANNAFANRKKSQAKEAEDKSIQNPPKEKER